MYIYLKRIKSKTGVKVEVSRSGSESVWCMWSHGLKSAWGRKKLLATALPIGASMTGLSNKNVGRHFVDETR